jgi:hypothetical protein
MSIFMAAYLVRYKILRCTVPESFYEMCNQILAEEWDDRLAISRRHNRFQYSEFQLMCTTYYERPTEKAYELKTSRKPM